MTGVKSSYAVGDLWSSEVAKDWCIATDDRDGEVDCVLNDTNLPLELVGESYYLNTVGSYTITYSATDAAGNTRTRDLTITISESTDLNSIDYTGFGDYYTSLNSSTDVVTDLAKLLRNTISYVSYGDARYVYATYDDGSQAIMYDVPTSASYGKVPATGTAGWGDGGKITGDGYSISINREHVWACNDMRIMPVGGAQTVSTYPKYTLLTGSFDYRPQNTNKGHYTDLHNLWNALAGPNGTHSDHFYGEENGSSVGTYLNNGIFYPGDEWKGDVARILFYMTLMYPHLTLVERGDANAYEGSTFYGYLEDLMRWNLEDPVSDVEVRRNNTIYANQNNRNPFVDFYDYGFAELLFEQGDPNILDS